jgi:hypothetical protein
MGSYFSGGIIKSQFASGVGCAVMFLIVGDFWESYPFELFF